jgi:hypothetical protein
MSDQPLPTYRTFFQIRLRDLFFLIAIFALVCALVIGWRRSSAAERRQSYQQTVFQNRVHQLWGDRLFAFGAKSSVFYDAEYQGVGIVVSERLDGYQHVRHGGFTIKNLGDSGSLKEAMQFVVPRLFCDHDNWQAVLERTLSEIEQLTNQAAATDKRLNRQFAMEQIRVTIVIEEDDDLTITMNLAAP